jgi:Common central domain of tyrosinase
MSDAEWKLYADGINGLRQKASTRYPGEGLNKLDEFARLHRDFGQHFGSNFLMWHRIMLWEFEKELDLVSRGARVPAYDWSQYSGTGDALRTSLFGPSRAGGSGSTAGPIPNGAFQGLQSSADGSTGPVLRAFDYSQVLHSRLMIDNAVGALQDYARFNVWLEGVHANFHNAIGGDMNLLSFSPAEPVFYMHHAFVDKVWRQWQQAGGGNNFNGNHPAVGGSPVGLDTVLQPWGRTARDILERISGCVQYANMGSVTRTFVETPQSVRQENVGNGSHAGVGGNGIDKIPRTTGDGIDSTPESTGESAANTSSIVMGGTAAPTSANVSVVPVLSSAEKLGYQYEVAKEKIDNADVYKNKVQAAVAVIDATKQSCQNFEFPPDYIAIFQRVESFALLKTGLDLADAEVAANSSTEQIRQEGIKEKAAIEQGNNSALKAAKKDVTAVTAVITKG